MFASGETNPTTVLPFRSSTVLSKVTLVCWNPMAQHGGTQLHFWSGSTKSNQLESPQPPMLFLHPENNQRLGRQRKRPELYPVLCNELWLEEYRGRGTQWLARKVFQNHPFHTNIWQFSADNFSYNVVHRYSKKVISGKKTKEGAA